MSDAGTNKKPPGKAATSCRTVGSSATRAKVQVNGGPPICAASRCPMPSMYAKRRRALQRLGVALEFGRELSAYRHLPFDAVEVGSLTWFTPLRGGEGGEKANEDEKLRPVRTSSRTSRLL
jgi:hypothetical protein